MEIYDDILFFTRGVCVKNVAFKCSNLMTEELKVFLIGWVIPRCVLIG